MANVANYHVLVYGTPDGYQDNRSQIALYGDAGNVLGYARFHDPGALVPNDAVVGGQIVMHLPSSAFQAVLDVLRNEKPINFYFASGHAFLGTGSVEPVGEAEA
jgi:hypothetical protein